MLKLWKRRHLIELGNGIEMGRSALYGRQVTFFPEKGRSERINQIFVCVCAPPPYFSDHKMHLGFRGGKEGKIFEAKNVVKYLITKIAYYSPPPASQVSCIQTVRRTPHFGGKCVLQSGKHGGGVCARKHFLILYLLIFRERGKGGRKRERNNSAQEKHRLVASHVPPTRDLACNPGMCPTGSQTGNSVCRPAFN